MEFRELKYFLAVAREENISKAAESLFVTQPNLSRQMQNLEDEVGKKLFVRGNRKITLTEAGKTLRKRAEEIMELYSRTESELAAPLHEICGDICIGGGESYAFSLIAETAKIMRRLCPDVRFNIFSGDTIDVSEKLDKGLFDFGILIEPADLSKYDYLRLPLNDTWGVLMRAESSLASKEFVTCDDLKDAALILSKHSLDKSLISDWFGIYKSKLNIAATYNLLYNASLLVKAGIGYAVGLDKIINTDCTDLCFKPLEPTLETHLDIVWKKNFTLSRSAEKFLELLREQCKKYGNA